MADSPPALTAPACDDDNFTAMATWISFRVPRTRVSAVMTALLCAGILFAASGCPASDRATSQPAAEGDSNGETVAQAGADEAVDLVRPGEIPGRVHIVERGDTLYSLASRYYGNGQQYNRILVANRNRLKDPRNLPVGMKLIIP